jgi:hypothetical protein
MYYQHSSADTASLVLPALWRLFAAGSRSLILVSTFVAPMDLLLKAADTPHHLLYRSGGRLRPQSDCCERQLVYHSL